MEIENNNQLGPFCCSGFFHWLVSHSKQQNYEWNQKKDKNGNKLAVCYDVLVTAKFCKGGEHPGGCGNCIAFLRNFNFVVRHTDENDMSTFHCNSTFIAKT